MVIIGMFLYYVHFYHDNMSKHGNEYENINVMVLAEYSICYVAAVGFCWTCY